MSKTVDSNHAQPALVVRHRTLPGELNRGAVDALQMVVYGGATGGGSLASDDLYLLDLRNGEQMA